VCRTAVAIDSYEGPSKKSESVEARYPDILLSDLKSAITNSRKEERPRNQFLSSGAVLYSISCRVGRNLARGPLPSGF
jgi:hypothetical protein